MNFSDYIVYVDESGDHNLDKPDSKYPVFVLSFCIFHKKYYNKHVVQAVQELKFRYFGHDMAILHERDILKKTGYFKDFSERKHQSFLNEITKIMTDTNFMMIACVIDKQKLRQKYKTPSNPYHLAVRFGLERLYNLMKEKEQHELKTYVVFEMRGADEDKELKDEFIKVCHGANAHDKTYPFEMILASKYVNSTGLQFADLTARPIGNHVLRPQQPNRAFDVIKYKLYCQHGRSHAGQDYMGYGLKIFP